MIVTANHYWVDAALGAMVAATSALIAARARAGAPGPGPSARRPEKPGMSLPRGSAPDGIVRAAEGPGRGRNGRPIRNAQEFREYARDRLIESRLTPNTISMTGLVLNVAAAVLVTQRLFVLAGVAFIVGSVMDTLDGRYSRMSGKGTPFGAFLDSTLDRIEEGVVLDRRRRLLRLRRRRRRGRVRPRRARLADGLLHPGPRRGARASSARSGSRPPGARGDPLGRARVRQGRPDRRLRPARGGDLHDGRR